MLVFCRTMANDYTCGVSVPVYYALFDGSCNSSVLNESHSDP